MADEEAERVRSAQSGTSAAIVALRERLQELATALKDSSDSPVQSASQYCQEFCQTLVEYAGQWRIEEDPLPLVEVYAEAVLCYARASPCLSPQCENVSLVLERLTLSCVELLLSLPDQVPVRLWQQVQSSVQSAHSLLLENGMSQLRLLSVLAQEGGAWANPTLRSILSKETTETETVHRFLSLEGPVLLEMRVKQLLKETRTEAAAVLAKACADFPGFEGRGHFKQTHLVYLCAVEPQERLMQELSQVDCRDALEMICNLESEGDEKGALVLCSAFLTRQLLQGDMYCAWELTLFWSKLLKRLVSSTQLFLDRCRQMSLLSKTVYHVLFLIKVVQSEMEDVGLPVCIEMCIRALQMESEDRASTKATICKTISCLLPSDLEVKRACQLTEFLLEPTVDSYYAVETLYNEPDQRFEEESLPVPNSLRCELLLVFKTQWPFDPEFWDWKTLKRHCLALMGEEASIVSSIDELNDGENPEVPEAGEETSQGSEEFRNQLESFWDATNELNEITDERRKKREIKKLREKGFISARFRNWQAYMQYCVLCDKEFLGHRIVRHAQTHFRDGLYSCPICTESFDSKEALVPHVASHVKQSCKERLAAMKASKKLANAAKASIPNPNVPKDGVVETQLKVKDHADAVDPQTFYNCGTSAAAAAKADPSAFRTDSSEEYTCPVANCRKAFKYYRNLMAHVKAHRNNDEARRFLEMQSKKVICQYCRRQFVSVAHLNDHLQVHCGVKPYICIQLNCNASFLSNAELLVHKEEHAVFKARCMFPSCGKVFSEAYLLYDHEAQHYKTFTCKAANCAKVFHSQSQLELHLEDHLCKEEPEPEPAQVQAEAEQPLKQESSCCPSREEPFHSASFDPEVVSDQGSPPRSSSPAADEPHLYLPVPVKVKHSVESMLNVDPGPVPQSECNVTFKSEPPDADADADHQPFPSPCSAAPAIHPPLSEPVQDPRPPRLGHPSTIPLQRDPGQLAPQMGTAQLGPPYQGVMQDSDPSSHLGVFCGTVSSSQIQVPVLKVEQENLMECRSESTGPVPAQHPGLFVEQNQPPGEQNQHCIPQLSSRVVLPQPPSAMPRVDVDRAPSEVSPSCSTSDPVQPKDEKQRHRCALETCTRDYSSYRSVTKHMKAAHPDFYAQWKLAKKNSKVPKAPARGLPKARMNSATPLYTRPVTGVPVPAVQMQMQNAGVQPVVYPSPGPNTPFPSHPANVLAQTLPDQVENVLNPTLLSQLGNAPNQTSSAQSHVGPGSPWPSPPVNSPDLSRQLGCSAHVLPHHLQALPPQPYLAQMGTVNAGMGQRPHAEGVNPFLRSEVDNDMRLAQVASEDGLHASHMSDFTAGMNPVAPPQMDVVNRGFVHTAPASQVMPSNTNANPVLASLASEVESLSRSVLPSYLAGPKDPLLPNQLESSANHMFPPHSQTPFSNFSASDRMIGAQMQNSMRPGFPPKGSSPSQAGANSCPSENGNVPVPVSDALAVKRTKRNKRAKWPAIIKDGKFICCRCFREFPSPKSLGGHLSKRSHCKAFDETDLSADLPTSFLDLLNSPHVLNAPPQPATPNFNPSMPFKEPGQVLARGPLEPRFFPNVTFPQANGSAYIGDTEQNGSEVLKQEMDNPAISNLYQQSGIPQPAFPSPCGSFTPGSRLPETTVTQHTGNMLIKTESEVILHQEDLMAAQDPGFGSADFPDHLISQMLAENNSAVSLSSLPTDHLNQILRAETLMKMREVKGSVDPPQSALSNDGLLAAMAELAQNLMTNPLLQITSADPRGPQEDACNKKSEKSVKKKLREQILAGDLLRRSNASRAPATDGNVGRTHPTAVCSQQGQPSKVTGTAPEGQLGAVMNSAEVVPVVPPQGEGTLPVVSNVLPPGVTSQEPGALATGGPIDADPCPDPSSAVEDAEVMEVQRALERLDLDKKVSDDPLAVRDVSSVNEPSFSSAVSVTANALAPVVAMAQDESFVKPFACENEGCNYRAMTKDALFKHLTKTHNYTREMINQIKKNHGKFAPFRCHMCNKTFTRNSNLRAHCQTVHGLSQDELVKLKIKRQNTKKAEKPDKDQVCTGINNLLCFQKAPPLSHHQPKESYTPQHADKSDLPLAQSLFYPEERTSQEYQSRSFVGPTSAGTAAPESSQENGLGPPSQAPQAGPTSCQAADTGVPPGVAIAGYPMEGLCSAPGPAAEHLTDWPEGPTAAACGQYVAAPSEAGLPPAVASSLGQAAPAPLQGDLLQAATLSPDKRPKVCKTKAPRPKPEKPKIESPKKAKEKKDKRPAVKNGEVDNGFSPYRPYRCVHQGCVAAFTIQQNLILHYKAVHQSALPRFEMGSEEKRVDPQLEVKGEQLGEVSQLKEFRCQVKDCSRIFQEVTGLLQHYLQLHKFTLDKAGALISTINLGRFQCDQPECTTFFTAFWKYVSHIEEDHKEASFSKAEPVEGLFRCEVEDCDRAYATRSNLLRHTMKKHHDIYKLQLMKQRKNQEREKQVSKKAQLVVLKTSNGKENVQNNKKPVQKGSDKKKNEEEKSNHWTKYGKPSLKSKEEASAMCTKKFPLQYPCMIKGCESVVSSERNILRHYVRHGLSERYLEEQRSHFIFCKKFSRSRFRYWSKGRNRFEDSSTETSDNEDPPDSPEENETEDSKPMCGTDETAEDGETSDAKQSTDDGSEGKSVASAVVKRKRGRPRKGCEESTPLTRRKAMERLRAARNGQGSLINSWSDSTSSSGAAVGTGEGTGEATREQCEQSVALSAFKPMGFEVSFLKFLEESAQSSAHPSKRKANEDSPCENPLKRTVQLKTATVLCKRSDAYVRPRDSQSSIDFRNPQNLSSLRNVKIVVDKTFSHVADLLLKQLQEMQPLVILQK